MYFPATLELQESVSQPANHLLFHFTTIFLHCHYWLETLLQHLEGGSGDETTPEQEPVQM